MRTRTVALLFIALILLTAIWCIVETGTHGGPHNTTSGATDSVQKRPEDSAKNNGDQPLARDEMSMCRIDIFGVDSCGDPIAKCGLQVTFAGGHQDRLETVELRDGKAFLAAEALGSASVSMLSRELANASLSGQSHVSITVTIPVLVTMRGLVVILSNGKVEAAPGASIQVSKEANNSGWTEVGQSDAYGAFEVRLPADIMHMRALDASSRESDVCQLDVRSVGRRDESTPSDAVRLTITVGTGSVSGLVVDSKGSPVADCSVVFALESRSTKGQVGWVMTTGAHATRTDQTGRFAFRAMRPGGYAWLVRDAVGRVGKGAWEVRDGENSSLRLKLWRDAHARLVVVDERQRPCPGAFMRWCDSDEGVTCKMDGTCELQGGSTVIGWSARVKNYVAGQYVEAYHPEEGYCKLFLERSDVESPTIPIVLQRSEKGCARLITMSGSYPALFLVAVENYLHQVAVDKQPSENGIEVSVFPTARTMVSAVIERQKSFEPFEIRQGGVYQLDLTEKPLGTCVFEVTTTAETGPNMFCTLANSGTRVQYGCTLKDGAFYSTQVPEGDYMVLLSALHMTIDALGGELVHIVGGRQLRKVIAARNLFPQRAAVSIVPAEDVVAWASALRVYVYAQRDTVALWGSDWGSDGCTVRLSSGQFMIGFALGNGDVFQMMPLTVEARDQVVSIRTADLHLELRAVEMQFDSDVPRSRDVLDSGTAVVRATSGPVRSYSMSLIECSDTSCLCRGLLPIGEYVVEAINGRPSAIDVSVTSGEGLLKITKRMQ